MHEVFEHTADIGLRIRAATLPDLFREAAEGLFELIVPDLHSVRQQQELHFEVPGEQDQQDLLLFDWLNELLYTFDAQRMLLARFDIALTSAGLRATAWGEAIDTSRHQLEHEVKAITYHGLKVAQEGNSWLAEVIVDI